MEKLKELLIKFLDTVAFPAIDQFALNFKTPFQIDDKIWEAAKNLIRTKLDMATVLQNKFGISMNGITAFNLKDAFKNFLVNDVFPEIDELSRKWHTPFEIDNFAWAYLKVEIMKQLDKLEIPFG